MDNLGYLQVDWGFAYGFICEINLSTFMLTYRKYREPSIVYHKDWILPSIPRIPFDFNY